MTKKRHNYFYGLEDYDIFNFYLAREWDCNTQDYKKTSTLVQTIWSAYVYIPIDKDHAKTIRKALDSRDEKEIKDVKSVYLYPECKVPRALLRNKFKLVNNYILADAIIVPEHSLWESNSELICAFKDDATKRMVVLRPKAQSSYEGTPENLREKTYTIRDLMQSEDIVMRSDERDNIKDFANFKLFYSGEALLLYREDPFAIDVYSGVLPLDKLYSEQAILKACGNEENKPTAESYANIREMLDSSDESTQLAGLKALSCMDYINYPETTGIMLSETWWRWRYNDKISLSSIKFMFNNIGIARGRSYRSQKTTISQKDYDLLKEYLIKTCKDNSEMYSKLKHYNFMYMDSNKQILPRIAS